MITKPEPYCPVCGAKMKLRKPKSYQSWKPFWGCSQYPDCGGTHSIMPDGRPDLDDEEWDDFDEYFYQSTMKGLYD